MVLHNSGGRTNYVNNIIGTAVLIVLSGECLTYDIKQGLAARQFLY